MATTIKTNKPKRKNRPRFRNNNPRTNKMNTLVNAVSEMSKMLSNMNLGKKIPTWENQGPTQVKKFSEGYDVVSSKLKKEGITIGRGGIDFLRAAVNPFGSGEPNGFRSYNPKIPDGARPTLVYTCTANFTHTGAGPLLMQMIPPDWTSGYIATTYSGGTCTDYTSSPTGKTLYAADQATALIAMLNATYIAKTEFRITGAAMRCKCTSAADATQGTFRAFLPKDHCLTGTTTYQAYGHCIAYPFEETRSVAEGITVRAPIDTTHFNDPLEFYYSTAVNSPFTRLPAVLYSGGAATTSFNVEFVMFIEAAVNSMNSSISPSVSLIEPFKDAVIAYANNEVELVVSGDTFKPLSQLLKFGAKAYKFADKIGLFPPMMEAFKLLK